MASPLSSKEAETAVRAAVQRVGGVPGWPGHSRNHKGPWGPVHGVMVHHIGGRPSDPVGLCHDGYASLGPDSLPGPLCHIVVLKTGAVHFVGWGRANHAGRGSAGVLRAVIAERALPAPSTDDTDGNTHFYGIELENAGDGRDPWPAVQLEAAAATAAALCKLHGWTQRSVIGHREWTRRKPDPAGFTMSSFRVRVEAALRGKVATVPKPRDPAQPAPAVTMADLERRLSRLETWRVASAQAAGG